MPDPLTVADELRDAPAAFRATVEIARRNWTRGSLTFVLPSGSEMRIQGSEDGPDGRLIVRDFRAFRGSWPPPTSASARVSWPANGTPPISPL